MKIRILALASVFVLALFLFIIAGSTHRVRYVEAARICEDIRAGKNIETTFSNGATFPEWFIHISDILQIQGPQIPLVEACYYRNFQAVETLLKNGADPNFFFDGHNSPLEAACLNTAEKGSISETSYEIVQLLLEHGANPNLYGARDSLLFQLAGMVAAGNDSDYLENIIFLLLDYEAELVSGGTLEKYDHDMLLTFAVQGNNLDFLEALYNKQCYDINHAGSNGVTPLIRAVLSVQDAPNSQIIRFLVKNGANPYITDKTGNSAYDYAQQLDYTEVILILDEATS